MKKIVILIIPVVLVFTACNRSDKNNSKISKRDYSITKANAFNNIFLDSAAVESYITRKHLPDSISRRMRSFYNTRNYQFAWFSSDGLSEQAMGFTSLKNSLGDTSSRQKNLKKIMDNIMGEEDLKISPKNKSIINTELLLTENLIYYSLGNLENGFVKQQEVERFIPYKKVDPLQLADSILNKKNKEDNSFSKVHKPYKLLTEQLKKYMDLATGGKWIKVEGDPKKFKEGLSSPGIASLKKMLLLTGDLNGTDTSNTFDANLKNGIKHFQSRFGYTPDGKITSASLHQMNVPPIERIKQILINLNRMRWLPAEPEGKLIVVNIPAFTLNVYDKKQLQFSMPVVVGKEGHNTTIFSDKLTTIVFSPYWNIPPSIVKNEIIPGMDSNQNYLETHNMEITGTEGGLPVVRQKPGPENSLGKVKFLFPNIFNIYFHDTPSKSLFNKDVRAYSHGCIRVSDPEKLAAYLLENNPSWTSQKIENAMNSGNEKYVQVKKPVPVFITYYTAWVDENNQLNFRDDIYGHDKEVAGKMFMKKLHSKK